MSRMKARSILTSLASLPYVHFKSKEKQTKNGKVLKKYIMTNTVREENNEKKTEL